MFYSSACITTFEKNNCEYIVANFIDISERKSLENKLHELSVTDELTGLLNRRGFNTLAERQLEIADRSKSSIHLIYTDIDNLKWINDNFGHAAGDKALKEVASALSTLRKSDIVGRLGGDEFAILITDTTARIVTA